VVVDLATVELVGQELLVKDLMDRVLGQVVEVILEVAEVVVLVLLLVIQMVVMEEYFQ
jgi:hypothetical protein